MKEILYECAGIIISVAVVVGWLFCWYIGIKTIDEE